MEKLSKTALIILDDFGLGELNKNERENKTMVLFHKQKQHWSPLYLLALQMTASGT